MSARANSARNAFHRSLNPWLRPQPSGPINKNQQPKRKTGINTTLDRFHKLIVDLNQQNAKLIETIVNMEKIQQQKYTSEEEDIQDQSKKEEEKQLLIKEFHTSISNHRKSLERRLKKLNEIEDSLSIFRFDEPQPQPPKVEYPPVNPNIPMPRAHLRTSPRFGLANSITKAENDQLTAKALYLERMIVVQKMKLKLYHDHRELAQLAQFAKELGEAESSIQGESTEFHATEPTTPRSSSGRNLKSPRTKILKNSLGSLDNSSNVSSNLEVEEEEISNELNASENRKSEENEFNNEDNGYENSDDINNDDDDGETYEEIEDQKLKYSIHVLKAAIEHEKKRIKQYKSKYYGFNDAVCKIQKVWRGYNCRLEIKKQQNESNS